MLPCCVARRWERASKTELELMLMMLALWFPEFVQSLGRSATLLCVQRPGDGSVRLNGFHLMLMMLAARFPEFVRWVSVGSKCYPAVCSKAGRWELASKRNSS